MNSPYRHLVSADEPSDDDVWRFREGARSAKVRAGIRAVVATVALAAVALAPVLGHHAIHVGPAPEPPRTSWRVSAPPLSHPFGPPCRAWEPCDF